MKQPSVSSPIPKLKFNRSLSILQLSSTKPKRPSTSHSDSELDLLLLLKQNSFTMRFIITIAITIAAAFAAPAAEPVAHPDANADSSVINPEACCL
ncbi:hypothetical protein CC78DRAFT_586626 [Lojkania enalia]|uniref:Uncharacterized protein n=1 Tax=Lojkania enalia TaxID=147567 RepID=A0A9P4K189_9PLEO|nr:hypothetical protein CC78DRAFT_586626 [Didymosphaeria enalia]